MSTVISNAPSIAVIIPLYNGSRYIEQALESVFNQSRAPSEVIVVDDGSTDDSYAFVEALRARFAFQLLHKTNSGQGSARNFGVAHATSDLVAYLDQDDIWYSDHLEQLIQPFLKSYVQPFGWSYGNMDVINERGEMHHRCYLDLLKQIPQPKISVIDCLRYDMHILPGASLVSRAAHVKVGGFDERLAGYEDDDYFLRLFTAGYISAYINTPVYQWRFHASSSSYNIRMARSRMIYARKLFDSYPDQPEMYRYLTRDTIAPRFLPEMIQCYLQESRAGRWETAEWALAECEFLSRHLAKRPGRRLGRVLRMLGLSSVRKLSRNKLLASRNRWMVRRALRHAGAIGRQP